MTVLTSLQVSAVLSYVIAIAVPALDAVFPVLPSETTIIALGVATAGSTDPRIALLVACCAAGAFLGDNLSYLLGRRFGPWAERRFFPGGTGAQRRAWAERSLERFGMQLIVVCRFFPGGRTAVTLCCGLIRYPRRRFVVATAVAGSIWAVYSFFLGRPGKGQGGVTPDRLSPMTPARTRPIDTSFRVDTASPRKIIPMIAAPAAPIPVQTAYAAPTSSWRSATVSREKLNSAHAAKPTVGHSRVMP